MTDIELRNLKDRLWHPADMLCAGAHLAANTEAAELAKQIEVNLKELWGE